MKYYKVKYVGKMRIVNAPTEAAVRWFALSLIDEPVVTIAESYEISEFRDAVGHTHRVNGAGQSCERGEEE